MAANCKDEDKFSPSTIHPNVKQQWQHCSLFNLDLFNDEQQNLINQKSLTRKISIEKCCCSLSTPNVDETDGKMSLHHSCSFVVLQKNNYTTHLEHVAENLLANKNQLVNNCTYCSTFDHNESKGTSSLNRKILLGSTAILDNFLRNNSKSTSTTQPNTMKLRNNPNGNGTNQRRWHSERGTRHPNVRVNLPLTEAQRQVLERYTNYPLIKPSTRRSHHQPITGKAGEATGTALSALPEQTMTVHLRKNSAPVTHLQRRPLSSTSSSASATSYQSALINRSSFPAETSHSKEDDETKDVEEDEDEDEDEEDDDRPSISSEFDSTSDEETSEIIETSSPIDGTEKPAECAICYEMKRLQKRPCCQFDVCSICLTMYVEQQVQQGMIRIQCPNQHCQIYMHRDEIHKRCSSPELRQKFARFIIDANRAINIKTCPRCSNIHEIDLELSRSKRRAPTKVQCVQCSLIWCFQCHSPWHDGIQCKEFRRGDRMLKKWAQEVHYGQQNAQQCPSCKVYIQRTKGCDHIVCLRCKTEFCYKCGDRFRDIKFIGDHYSELSVLGCKYRFYPDQPFKRRLIRGSILCGKVLAAPVLLCMAVVAGTVVAGVGLPTYCCVMLVRHIKAKRRRRRHAKLKEPILMSYKTLNEMVPQLIPRDPVNTTGVKMPSNLIRTTVQDSETINIEIDPTRNAPIAVLDECDTHLTTNPKDDFVPSLPMNYASTPSPNFPRLSLYETRRKFSSRLND